GAVAAGRVAESAWPAVAGVSVSVTAATGPGAGAGAAATGAGGGLDSKDFWARTAPTTPTQPIVATAHAAAARRIAKASQPHAQTAAWRGTGHAKELLPPA